MKKSYDYIGDDLIKYDDNIVEKRSHIGICKICEITLLKTIYAPYDVHTSMDIKMICDDCKIMLSRDKKRKQYKLLE